MLRPQKFFYGGDPSQAGVVSVGKDKPLPPPPHSVSPLNPPHEGGVPLKHPLMLLFITAIIYRINHAERFKFV